MNKTKIEWCDSTWNPVTGCLYRCEYCYARRIAARFGGYDSSGGSVTTRNPLPRAELLQPLTIIRKNGETVNSPFPFGFEPTLHYYRLDEPRHRREPQTIFVCSMADLFGDWVPVSWIMEVFAACEAAPWHCYLFLTKNPERYQSLAMAGILPEKDNFWYGSSTPDPNTPFWWSKRHNTFASIEPMMEPFPSAGDCSVKKLDWVIMGAMTWPGSKAHQPEREWVESLVRVAQAANVPVFLKNSLLPIMGEENMRQEVPWGK